ncbi:MAG: hypothetical protein KJZ59_12220, partial [Pararhodobacter sp.]|nr:hypothetical protein [Pararhodobacter sp.]
VTALRLQRVELEIDPAPEPATAAGETLTIAPVEPVADPAPVQPVGAPDGQVEIVDQDPPRRGLRDLFRRRDPAPDMQIAATPLAPVAGAGAEAGAATAAAAADT